GRARPAGRRGVEPTADLRHVADPTGEGEPAPAGRGRGRDAPLVDRDRTDRVRPAEPLAYPLDPLLHLVCLRWVGSREPFARVVGRELVRFDVEPLGERDGVLAREEYVRRLLHDTTSDADRVTNTGHRTGRTRLPLVGHDPGIGSDDAVGLDRPADPGVESWIRFEDVDRAHDRLDRRRCVRTDGSGLVENRLSPFGVVGFVARTA